ncbi:MAG: DNA methyltransferase [Patescibacteria group bacterium]
MKKSKMNGNSFNPQEELLELLRKNFPEIFTEGRVDCEKLKKSLGENLNKNGERYGLSWAGKADCFRQIQEPTTATLKPNRGESVDFDTTKNLFIEGDNLQVLKILQKSYYGKVKMIYIDPPYNTGNDSFIYPDKFQESREDYLERIGEKDEEGNLMRDGMFQKNSRENGHYHSNWLSMMYPRLFLARNLLKPDGVIFVSIDDHEVHNLRMIMNEIFGEENFVAEINWKKKTGAGSKINFVFDEHEYVLVYLRNRDVAEKWRIKNKNDGNFRNPDKDERGNWESCALTAPSTNNNPNQLFAIEIFFDQQITPLNKDDEGRGLISYFNYLKHTVALRELVKDDTATFEKYDEQSKHAIFIRRWVNTKKTIKNLFEQRKIYFNKGNLPRYKKFESDYEGKALRSIYFNEFSTQQGSDDFIKIMKFSFDYPKPIELIKHFAKAVTSEDDIILDFFAGSGTTAHAVMALNAEDGGNRKCISIQLPELCAEDSEAAKAGFETIADIAKERIRRAGKKIAEEKSRKLNFENQKLDTGFKVFKLDESNFKIWRSDVSTVEELKKQMDLFVDNVKPVAAKNLSSLQENILHELILKSGLDLNVPIAKREADKKQYFALGEGELIICLEDKISPKLVEKILSKKPQKIVCLDKAFGGNDQLKTNTILQAESEGVEFKVI